ncbi:MAG: triphosphoribosyl-dephospho-CoA synthase [Candidatus Lokiarchaeota archaeon]|nr:triphosphoribosyl-dephospho-CoA synthase [Candidatus Lokiarchaeota archaeon]
MAGLDVRVASPAEAGRFCTLASLLEVSASPKPGNVHRFSDPSLHGKTYEQFLSAIVAMSPHFTKAADTGFRCVVGGNSIEQGLHMGPAIKGACEAMVASQRAGNLLLGHVLLLVPLATATGAILGVRGRSIAQLRSLVGQVTRSGDASDVTALYEGIRSCNPGGLGNVEALDVTSPRFREELLARKATFQDAFSINKETDAICREWTSSFETTFTWTLPRLLGLVQSGVGINDAIVQAFVELLARQPDSLIKRKNGDAAAVRVSDQARLVVEAGGMLSDAGRAKVRALDEELASARGKLNPGTTADLVAAGVYLLLATGTRT